MSQLGLRAAVVVASFLVGVWLLLPTFLGPEVQEQLAYRAKWAANPDLPAPVGEEWFVPFLPARALGYGLDIVGGIDLTLDVDADEAIRAHIQRDVIAVERAAEQRSIAVADVERDRRRLALRIQPGPGVDLAAATALLGSVSRAYTYLQSETDAGVTWHVFEVTEDQRAAITEGALQQAEETIRTRIDATGVKEPVVTRKGERGISIQLPGATNVDDATAAVRTRAQLEFFLVDEDADLAAVLRGVEAAKAALDPAAFQDDAKLSEWLAENAWLESNRALLWEYTGTGDASVRDAPYVLRDRALLTGDDIADASTNFDETEGWYVVMEFEPDGARIFADITGQNVGKRFAIVLDGRVRSAPNIVQKITGGGARITSSDKPVDEQLKDASMLALVLRSGALPAPVELGEVRKVGPGLGAEAVREGTLAALVGSGLVLLVAAWYYRISGLLADVSLVLNAFLVIAALAAFGATLTLPGICGIALTVGMAVDCNIIIFERIREELRAERSVVNAINAGFDRAAVAVLDSNVTTLLAGVVLYSYGTGPLRGFAVTLMIGIFTTVYTGVFVTRVLMELVNRGNRPHISI